MAKFNISQLADFILPAGLLYLGYKTLQGMGLINPVSPGVSTAITPECPRGAKYTRGYFGTCDPNYLSQGALWDDLCVCIQQPKQPVITQAPPPVSPPSGAPAGAPGGSILGGIIDSIFGGSGGGAGATDYNITPFIPSPVPSSLAPAIPQGSTGDFSLNPQQVGVINPITGASPWQQIQASSTPVYPSTPSYETGSGYSPGLHERMGVP